MGQVVEEDTGPGRGVRLDEMIQHLLEVGTESEVDQAWAAQEFGVEEAFVTDVLSSLEAPTVQTPFHVEAWRSLGRRLNHLKIKISRAFRKITAKPEVFIIYTGVAVALLWLIAFITDRTVVTEVENGQNFAMAGVLSQIAGLASVLVLISHFTTFFLNGKVKLPLQAGAVLFLINIPSAVVLGFRLETMVERFSTSVAVGLIIVASLIFTAIYTGLGLVSSVLGQYRQIKDQDKKLAGLTRQEMISRLFTIRDRLREASESPGKLKRKRTMIERARTSAAFPLSGVLFGLAFGVIRVVITWGLAALPIQGARPSIIESTNVFFNLVGIFGVVLLGYFTGSVWRSFIAVISAYGAALMCGFIPLSPHGPAEMGAFLAARDHNPQMVFMLILALLSGWSGQVDERGMRHRRLRTDDPAALIGEAIRIQKVLNPKTRSACVVVVDVARSTRIKMKADPLDIEFTFREYHNLVQEAAASEGGEVLSTAGDGAVLGFESPEQALTASKKVQTEMTEFNSQVNRLVDPLRLRIGIHCGQTASSLQEVPYNELIDIAAHVEASAPVGGIAVTEQVVKYIEDEAVAEIKDEIDGHRVSIVLNPTNAA